MIPAGAAFVFQNLQGKLKTLCGRLAYPALFIFVPDDGVAFAGVFFGDLVAAPVGREFVAALAHLFKPFVRNSRGFVAVFSPSPASNGIQFLYNSLCHVRKLLDLCGLHLPGDKLEVNLQRLFNKGLFFIAERHRFLLKMKNLCLL
jgi:hypothetical protein